MHAEARTVGAKQLVCPPEEPFIAQPTRVCEPEGTLAALRVHVRHLRPPFSLNDARFQSWFCTTVIARQQRRRPYYGARIRVDRLMRGTVERGIE